MANPSPDKVLNQLREHKSRLDREAASVEGRLDTLQAERRKVLDTLNTKFGISDPADIPERLRALEQEGQRLLQDIEEGTPERYR